MKKLRGWKRLFLVASIIYIIVISIIYVPSISKYYEKINDYKEENLRIAELLPYPTPPESLGSGALGIIVTSDKKGLDNTAGERLLINTTLEHYIYEKYKHDIWETITFHKENNFPIDEKLEGKKHDEIIDELIKRLEFYDIKIDGFKTYIKLLRYVKSLSERPILFQKNEIKNNEIMISRQENFLINEYIELLIFLTVPITIAYFFFFHVVTWVAKGFKQEM